MHSRFRRLCPCWRRPQSPFLPAAPAFADESHGPKANPRSHTGRVGESEECRRPCPERSFAGTHRGDRRQGSWKLENPSDLTSYYGYDNDGPQCQSWRPALCNSQGRSHQTEPDKNTYLVLTNQHGADLNYDYGTHFLFQATKTVRIIKGYITRTIWTRTPHTESL